MSNGIILNEKELRDARIRVAKLTDALTSERTLEQLVAGLPPQVITQVVKMMEGERKNLEFQIEAYEVAKQTGDTVALQENSGNDPGVTLIVARIAKGYSQKDLAWRLGQKEQQIQRYEADRYSSISIKNYARIATLLGVRLHAKIEENPNFRGLDDMISNVTKEDIRKIIKHGREHDWFSDEMDASKLQQYIAENRIQFGSPALLRTGLNVKDHSEDVLLHAWRARVSAQAAEIMNSEEICFDPIEINWLTSFVRLSALEDGPKRAQETLKQHGIVLIAEPQIPGLAIDGAAFLVGDVPVIGMTLRNDAVDNFWFSLMHEIGHAILHYRTGLAIGFFDATDGDSIDEQEAEANLFAANILIPEERWRRSTARIASSPEVVEKFARELEIHPAIAFGRIRKERNNFALFSNKIGRNTVRKQLFLKA